MYRQTDRHTHTLTWNVLFRSTAFASWVRNRDLRLSGVLLWNDLLQRTRKTASENRKAENQRGLTHQMTLPLPNLRILLKMSFRSYNINTTQELHKVTLRNRYASAMLSGFFLSVHVCLKSYGFQTFGHMLLGYTCVHTAGRVKCPWLMREPMHN